MILIITKNQPLKTSQKKLIIFLMNKKGKILAGLLAISVVLLLFWLNKGYLSQETQKLSRGQEEKKSLLVSAGPFVKNQLIVKFKTLFPEDEPLPKSIEKINLQFGLQKREKIFEDDLSPQDATLKRKLELRQKRGPENGLQKAKELKEGFRRTFLLTFKEDVNLENLLEAYRKDPNVEYAEPNYIFKTQMTPNDPYFSSRGSWGQDYDDQWDMKKIQAPEAWDINQGEGVVVAVIDSGVDYLHPDIDDNMWISPEGKFGHDYAPICHEFAFSCDPRQDNDPMDEHGHGTFCAGTIAAVANNNSGLAGVAPRAKIMAIRVLDQNGFSDDVSLGKGVQRAVDDGADILSCSWGKPGPPSQLLKEKFDYAWARGVVSVAAAGNENSDVNPNPYSTFMPAGFENVMAVAATDQNDKRCFFSNFGTKIEVVGPGCGSGRWEVVNNPTSSGGQYARNNHHYSRATLAYTPSKIPYEISFYTNQGPNNDNLNYFLNEAEWDSLRKVWKIKKVYAQGQITGYSETNQYHVPHRVNVQTQRPLFIDIRKQNLNQGFFELDAIEIREPSRETQVFEEQSPPVVLKDFEMEGILSLRANHYDFYGSIHSDPTYYNPPFPRGLMIVPEMMTDGTLYRAKGTSMAAPYVSGVTALILSKYPQASNEFVRKILTTSADNIDRINPGFEGKLGAGRLNAYRALTEIVSFIDSPQSGENLRGSVEIKGSVVGSDLQEYQLFFSPKGNINQKQAVGSRQTRSVINEILATWDTTNIPEGQYILQLQAKRRNGSTITDEKEVNVNFPLSTVTFLKENQPLRNQVISVYDNNNNFLESLTTDSQGQAFLSFLTGTHFRFKTTYEGIAFHKEAISPAAVTFDLQPVNVTAKQNQQSGIANAEVEAKKGQEVLVRKKTDASGKVKFYLEKDSQIKLSASFKGILLESESLTVPADHEFNFWLSKLTLRHADKRAMLWPNPVTVKVFQTGNSQPLFTRNLGSSDQNGEIYFNLNPGLSVYFEASYLAAVVSSETITTPNDVLIYFPEETTVALKDPPLVFGGLAVRAFEGNIKVAEKSGLDAYNKGTFCFNNPKFITFEVNVPFENRILRKTVKTPAEVTLQFLPTSIVTLKDSQGQVLPYQQVQVYMAESPTTTKVETQYTDFFGQAYFTAPAGQTLTVNPRCPGFSQTQTITSPTNITFQLPQTTTVTLKKADGTPLQTHVLAYQNNTYLTLAYPDSSGKAIFCFAAGETITFKAAYQGETREQTVTTPTDLQLIFPSPPGTTENLQIKPTGFELPQDLRRPQPTGKRLYDLQQE